MPVRAMYENIHSIIMALVHVTLAILIYGFHWPLRNSRQPYMAFSPLSKQSSQQTIFSTWQSTEKLDYQGPHLELTFGNLERAQMKWKGRRLVLFGLWSSQLNTSPYSLFYHSVDYRREGLTWKKTWHRHWIIEKKVGEGRKRVSNGYSSSI